MTNLKSVRHILPYVSMKCPWHILEVLVSETRVQGVLEASLSNTCLTPDTSLESCMCFIVPHVDIYVGASMV